MELDTDMRAAVTNIVFVDENMISFMNPQDNGDGDDDRDYWVIFESKATHKIRL